MMSRFSSQFGQVASNILSASYFIYPKIPPVGYSFFFKYFVLFCLGIYAKRSPKGFFWKMQSIQQLDPDINKYVCIKT